MAWTGTIPSFLAGQRNKASKLQTVADVESALTGSWTSYSPTWSSSGTQPVLNDGTLTGVYMQANKLIAVRITLVAGAGTTYGTGAYRFTLPATPLADQIIGALLNDSSGSVRFAGQCWIIAALSSGDNMRIVFSGESGFANLTATLPITLASGDRLILQGVYEAS